MQDYLCIQTLGIPTFIYRYIVVPIGLYRAGEVQGVDLKYHRFYYYMMPVYIAKVTSKYAKYTDLLSLNLHHITDFHRIISGGTI